MIAGFENSREGAPRGILSVDECDAYVSERIASGEIDFVADITSHWHAVGVDSFVESLRARVVDARGLRGIVLISPHARDGFLIGPADFACGAIAHVDIVRVDKSSRRTRRTTSLTSILTRVLPAIVKCAISRRTKRELHFVNVLEVNPLWLRLTRWRDINSAYTPVFVMIEEGIGTYVSESVWRAASRIDSGAPWSIRARLRREAPRVVLKSIARLARVFIRSERQFLLTRSKDGFVGNAHVVSSFSMALARRASRHADLRLPDVPLVLMLTQPFSEYGQISVDEELRVLNDLERAAREHDFCLIIKPHPREDIRKYREHFKGERVRLIRGNFPAEELLSHGQLRAVLAYNSTTLLNAQLIYRLPAVCLVDAVNLNPDEDYDQSVREFKDICRSFVEFPTSVDFAIRRVVEAL